ncbi:GNAT family N-acetyltransferase [Alteromonas oceanisediminis]|uniref:GNAT family N-acetyltransferase n=1 Tax=Alteromonas oceanisediminis TaxID=2836180 RepID=UPI001BDA9FF5|nr:GNAT family N-acetyltransferase [Alteromonas oceanisediminis]MBT0587883.1 GNAT family N-acetyltransferase [Alteromonas oceanisediminis]
MTISIFRATPDNSRVCAALLLSSAPKTLTHLLAQGNTQRAFDYLTQAWAFGGGQFGCDNHWLAQQNGTTVGMVSAWHDALPSDFDAATLASLRSYFSIEECLQILARNAALAQQLPKPEVQQVILGHLSVHEAYRRQGIARKLINHVIEFSRQKQKTQLVVDVESDNIAAIQCYLLSGFTRSDNASTNTPQPETELNQRLERLILAV